MWYLENKDGTHRECTIEEFVKMYDDHSKRSIGRTQVGNLFVSTVFLGLDHSFGGPELLLYETMIFWNGKGTDQYQERYSTRKEAGRRHKEIVKELEEQLNETAEELK